MLSVTPSPVDSEMATNNNDNLLKQIIEAENSHDIKKLLELVAEDVVIEDVPFVMFGMVMKRKDSVRQGYAGFIKATPDFKIVTKSWVINDRSFASEMGAYGDTNGRPSRHSSISKALLYKRMWPWRI